jgi:hypothetical protein
MWIRWVGRSIKYKYTIKTRFAISSVLDDNKHVFEKLKEFENYYSNR